MKRLIDFLVVSLCAVSAHAQPYQVVASCGSVSNPGAIGSGMNGYIDTSGNICTNASSGSSVTPTGAPTAIPLPTLASQQGVLLDAFKVAGDPDDTASMTRAVAAGVPILLGPKTYTINNFSSGGSASNFTLIGVRGKSIIQRTSASGSNFFTVGSATISIDGVTFDSNKAVVTANQWGVLFSAGGQTINISNSIFKNNSGSLGSCLALLSTGPGAGGSFKIDKSEITGCTFNPLYLASVAHGVVSNNYIHDNTTTGGIVQANGAASSTNYSTDIVFAANRVYNNTGTGLALGSFAPPYVYGTPAATFISIVAGNVFQDNGGYQLGFVNTQQVLLDSNQFVQSTSSVSTSGGIDCNSQYFMIQNNNVSMPSASYGIDCGGATEPNIRNNTVTMGARGAAIDVGGAQNGAVSNNHISVAGTAAAVIIFDVETDGNLVPFPYHVSNVNVQNNDILLSGASSVGIQTYDDAGAISGSLPINVFGNRFVGTGGANSPQDVNFFSSGTGILIQGNTHNGLSTVPIALNGSTDYVFDNVYDGFSGDATTGAVRSIVNGYIGTYNAGTKILYVTPTAGGTGYTAATTLTPSGGCTWTGSALISSGVIIGVRTTFVGATCSSGTTIAAADSGGGSGATFAVSVTPTLSSRKILQYKGSAGNVVALSGGAIGISGAISPIMVQNGYYLNLVGNGGGTGWVLSAPPPQSTFTSLNIPTCSATYNGVWSLVTDALTPVYGGTLVGGGAVRAPVVCNSTNWLTH